MLHILLGADVKPFPAHYVPSPEKLAESIGAGVDYGLLPVQQCSYSIQQGHLVNLATAACVSVDLYWHYWNINSKILTDFTRYIEAKCKNLLKVNLVSAPLKAS